MSRKAFLAIMPTLLMLSTLFLAFYVQPVKTQPKAIIVPDDYQTIQGAINAANEGDTVFVRNGVYYENVVVNKTISLIGGNRYDTIIDGNHNGPVIKIVASYVNITGFTFQRSGPDPNCGVYLSRESRRNNISHIIVRDNYYGILLSYSSNNTICGNNITNNYEGILLSLGSSYNVFRSNSMADNHYNFGVFSYQLSELINDIDTSNTVDGKPVYYWINKRDMAIPPDAGYVALISCTNITVQNLDLTHNEQGILLSFTQNSQITGNNITKNRYGIWMDKSTNNKIFGNTIVNNNVSILGWYSFFNNFYHNNFASNAGQVCIEGSVNFWDNNYPYGGNHWSDYIGNDAYCGLYQNETGCDGIGDTPYVIDANNKDRYPLMETWTPPVGIHNVAITDLTISTNETYHGSAIEINATVQNRGDQTERCLTVTAYYNSTPIQTKTVTNLAPNHQVTLLLIWNTKSVIPGNYTISARASPVPGETGIEDNGLTHGVVKIKPVPGDVNADGEVDMKDIYQLVLRYMCVEEEPCYLLNCDINCDGTINMKDIYIAILNFGD